MEWAPRNRVARALGAGSSTVADETRELARHRSLPGWQEGVALAAAAGRLGGAGAAGRVADAARGLPARMAQAQLRAGTRDAPRLALEAERALLHLDSLLEIGLLEGEYSEEAARELRGYVDRLLELLHGRAETPMVIAVPAMPQAPVEQPPAVLVQSVPEPPHAAVEHTPPTSAAAPPIAASIPTPVITPPAPVITAPITPVPIPVAPTLPKRPVPPPQAAPNNGSAASIFSTPARPTPPVDRLIIDGCNFLGRARGFDLGNVESRDRLLFRLQEYARKHPAHRILLFFDGQHASRKVTAGIEERIISADRTADDGIVDFLKNLSPTDRPRATLVTDDRELMRRALAEGARRESVAWLAERLNRKSPPAAAEGPVRREGGLSRNELEDWEQFFSQPPDRPGKG